MKKTLLLTVIAIFISSLSASAQLFRWGIRAGMTINELSFSKSVFHSSNRNGFTGGVSGEINIPVIGISIDGSLMYANRSFEYSYKDEGIVYCGHESRSYIDIPVNFKYMFRLPVISKVFVPFISTGPDFSFLISSRRVNSAIRNGSFDTAWTAGLGAQLFTHLQLHATYGWGLNKSTSGDDPMYSSKNRCWTITATWYF